MLSNRSDVTDEEIKKFNAYNHYRLLDRLSWQKIQNPEYREFLASQRITEFPVINKLYYKDRAKQIYENLKKVPKEEYKLLVVEPDLYDYVIDVLHNDPL